MTAKTITLRCISAALSARVKRYMSFAVGREAKSAFAKNPT
jgi:hypothetical protein